MGKHKSKYIIVPGHGDPCPCGSAMRQRKTPGVSRAGGLFLIVAG